MTCWVSAALRFRVRVLGKAETWEGLMTHKIHFGVAKAQTVPSHKKLPCSLSGDTCPSAVLSEPD